jgi:hypothetical protein
MHIVICEKHAPYPGGGEAAKGLAVRQLKRYASWVQTVEHLFCVAYAIKGISSLVMRITTKYSPIIKGCSTNLNPDRTTTKSSQSYKVFSSTKRDRTNHITAAP